MRVRMIGVLAAVLMAMTAEAAWACPQCRQNPCVMPVMDTKPAVKFVIEPVQYTVLVQRVRVDYREETTTVMKRMPETTYTEVQRVVCRPKVETTMITKQIPIRRPEFDTHFVTETYTTCRPVQTTRRVTEIEMRPTSKLVSVVAPTVAACAAKRSRPAPARTSALTCVTPVPVVREVVETSMVPEVRTRQVPVTTCRMVQDVQTVEVPVTHVSMVQEVVTDRVPHVTIKCVPETGHPPDSVPGLRGRRGDADATSGADGADSAADCRAGHGPRLCRRAVNGSDEQSLAAELSEAV